MPVTGWLVGDGETSRRIITSAFLLLPADVDFLHGGRATRQTYCAAAVATTLRLATHDSMILTLPVV